MMDPQNSVESKNQLCDARIKKKLLGRMNIQRFIFFFFSFSLALTIALIDALADKNDKVRISVAQSIVDTGKKLPRLTIALCMNYLDKHSKLPELHRASILRVIERILNYQQDNEEKLPFDRETFQSLTRIAVNELTMPKVSFNFSILFLFDIFRFNYRN